uniref:Uncharacterized protein n=1 Tax=Magallana gigas TaxID=29159 RepID=K1QW64_MAGGI
MCDGLHELVQGLILQRKVVGQCESLVVGFSLTISSVLVTEQEVVEFFAQWEVVVAHSLEEDLVLHLVQSGCFGKAAVFECFGRLEAGFVAKIC